VPLYVTLKPGSSVVVTRVPFNPEVDSFPDAEFEVIGSVLSVVAAVVVSLSCLPFFIVSVVVRTVVSPVMSVAVLFVLDVVLAVAALVASVVADSVLLLVAAVTGSVVLAADEAEVIDSVVFAATVVDSVELSVSLR